MDHVPGGLERNNKAPVEVSGPKDARGLAVRIMSCANVSQTFRPDRLLCYGGWVAGKKKHRKYRKRGSNKLK